ncbi:shikimate dehydrogenase [Alicyclobacillus acidocaldarius]|uniref:shikimate dehydrogenase n=1 Tax=Alicyclobacillus acidocaldarius TaxID=405212 RepID=UPI00345E5B21
MRLFGVIGKPVMHSLSPAMMNAAFRAQGVDAVYLPFQVEPGDLVDALRGLRAIGAVGINVTIPHKLGVYDWVDARTEAAEMARAVNVVRFTPTGAVGHNTDVSGWWASVAPFLGESSLKVAILGAGGSVQAILTALAKERPGSEVLVCCRRPEQAEALAARYSDWLSVRHVAWPDRHEAIARADLVVQCTPIGMWPRGEESPVESPECFQPHQVVQDIVYRPLHTVFLRQAQARGAKIVDGASMLIWQGVKAYEWWLEREAPVEVMQRAVYEALEREEANGHG